MVHHIEDLILLNTAEGLGFKKFEKLLNVFHNTHRILKAAKAELLAVDGIDKKLAERIVSLEKTRLSKELRAMEKAGVRALSVFDGDYPENLKRIYSPPLILYVKGEMKSEDADAVAIVGSRIPSHYGIAVCERLAYELASRGITVVSGLARGIDSAAHRGAMRGGRTLAVLGSGLNYIYPPENRNLAAEIYGKGALISEFPMNTPPHRHNFPRRNRIISGLSLGVVVAEASEKSGSLITAHFALEDNREIFAVPGQAGSRTSTGANNLIKQGAKLVENADDIIEEIENNLRYKNSQSGKKAERRDMPSDEILTDEERGIKMLLSYEPLYIDELARLSNTDPGRINSVLLSLELKNIIKELPGKNFVLK